VTTPQLLTTATVADYLAQTRLLASGAPATVTELDGGVSNIVVAVEAKGVSWVVKQSLPKLRVAEDWQAKQERTLNEANGLRAAGAITPDRVPAVVSYDPDQFVLVIERAPRSWTPWKQQLMAGEVDEHLAHSVGSTLAAWHATTVANPALTEELDDPEAFEQLRVAPYYRAAANRLPAAADNILSVVEQMAQRRQCLVHGDFSPKNILVGAGGFWVLDFEVAHRGDPDFDRAFLMSHLLLKAIHRPDHHQRFLAAAASFLAGYDETAPPTSTWRSEPTHLSRQLGCLLLARAVGKSPAEYLNDRGKRTALEAGLTILAAPPDDTLETFDLIAEGVDLGSDARGDRAGHRRGEV